MPLNDYTSTPWLSNYADTLHGYQNNFANQYQDFLHAPLVQMPTMNLAGDGGMNGGAPGMGGVGGQPSGGLGGLGGMSGGYGGGAGKMDGTPNNSPDAKTFGDFAMAALRGGTSLSNPLSLAGFIGQQTGALPNISDLFSGLFSRSSNPADSLGGFGQDVAASSVGSSSSAAPGTNAAESAKGYDGESGGQSPGGGGSMGGEGFGGQTESTGSGTAFAHGGLATLHPSVLHNLSRYYAGR